MDTEKILNSVFLPEFLVLGLLRSVTDLTEADELIKWVTLLDSVNDDASFRKLTTLSGSILNNKTNQNKTKTKDLCENLVELAKTSVKFDKLVELVNKYAGSINDVSSDKICEVITKLFEDIGATVTHIKKEDIPNFKKDLIYPFSGYGIKDVVAKPNSDIQQSFSTKSNIKVNCIGDYVEIGSTWFVKESLNALVVKDNNLHFMCDGTHMVIELPDAKGFLSALIPLLAE